nr:glutamate receptor ionotropic, delta-1-like [Parasteatoda tepidariorum]
MKIPQELTIAIVLAPNLRVSTDMNGNRILSKLEGRFIQLLMDTLKMPFKLIVASDNEWGRELSNGTWTGMLGLVHRGEADMAINAISSTEDRLQVVDFSIPYTEEDVKFFAPSPKRVPTMYAYLYPFSFNVWLLSLCVLFLLPLIYALTSKDKRVFFKFFLDFFGSLLRAPIADKDKSLKRRFFLLLSLIFSFILSSCYCAVLLSFLSIPLYESVPRNFNDLSKSVIKGQYECQVFAGTFLLQLMLNSTDRNLRKMGRIIRKNSWTFQADDAEDGTFNKKRITIITAAGVPYMYDDYNSLVVSEDSLITTSICVALRKNFCHKDKVNEAITRIRNAGLYDKIITEEVRFITFGNKNNDAILEAVHPIRLRDIYGPIIILVFGYIVSILALIGEIILANLTSR